jgi:hypothetical protein
MHDHLNISLEAVQISAVETAPLKNVQTFAAETASLNNVQISLK